jgi:PEP-CTERM motif
MFRDRLLRLAGAIAFAAALAVPGAAAASTFTISNPTSAPTTLVEAYQGASPDGIYGSGTWGSDWGENVGSNGDPYQTTAATITWTGNTINIVFTTTFPANGGNGVDTAYAQPVYAADIFIKSGGTSTAPAANQFNYAIALGYTATADGGLSAGVYAVTSEKTSQQVWSQRNKYTYGGMYAVASDCAVNSRGDSTDCTSPQQAPTVLTGGTQEQDITVNTTFGSDTVDVAITATDATGLAELQSIFGDSFDLFWGTGDCSNAPIYGVVTLGETEVPEPGSLALFGTALLGLAVFGRRRLARARAAR